MSSEKGQNIFMPKKINCFSINITLEGIEKIKTSKKNDNKTVRRIFLSSTLEGNINKHCNPFSILIGCLHRAIILFSLFIGFFQRAEIHFSPPNFRQQSAPQCPTE